MFRHLIFVTILVLGTAYKEENGVLVLTDADFTSAVKEHSFLFVKFYTPWCTHCKKLAPIWIQLAAELKISHPQIRFAQIDLEENKETQTIYRVGSYPSLYFFKNGIHTSFSGTRTKEAMKFWLGKKILAPIISLDESKISSLLTDGLVSIVFYGDLDSPQGKTLMNVAKVDDYNMYYVVQSSSKTQGSVEMYRPFGQTVTNDIVDYNIRGWINLYDRPFVFPYDDRTSKQIFTEKRNGIISFPSDGEKGELLQKAYKQAATEWRVQLKKKLVFTTMNIEDSKDFLDHIKVDISAHPIVYIKSAEKLKYLYPTGAEISGSKIVEFIKLVESGKIKKYKLEDETRPNPPPKTEQL